MALSLSKLAASKKISFDKPSKQSQLSIAMKKSSILCSALFGSVSVLSSLVITNIPSVEAAIPCSSSVTTADLLNDICTTSAQNYGLTLYQIGICKNDPLSSNIPDTSSCQLVYENKSGQYVDLGQATSNPAVVLSNTSGVQRPANGTYPYLYLSIGSTVRIKGQATIDTGTYFTSDNTYVNPNPGQTSTGALATTNNAQYSVYSSPLYRVGDGSPSCFSSNPYGGADALLTSGYQPTTYNSGSNVCPGAAVFALSASMSSLYGQPLTIDQNTKGINLKFSTSSDAIGLFANPNGASIDYVFDFLGFKLSFGLLT